jgi:hypothetical protein
MAYEIVKNSPLPKPIMSRPSVTSYDSLYENSLDHYIDLKCLVEDEDRESTPTTFAIAS